MEDILNIELLPIYDEIIEAAINYEEDFDDFIIGYDDIPLVAGIDY